jgi:threonine dehydrogenase-like Zn-dependent dehydrogenase
MKALRFTGGELAVADVPVPSPGGEALVRVRMSGICNTDLEITRGYAGFEGALGHEFVGVVEEARDAPDLTGKRVVGEINAGCGTCDRCLAGDPRHCPTRTVLGIHGRDGAHAEFLRLPTRNLIVVPDSVSDEQAVFAEPLAAAHGIADRAGIRPDDRIAVIGDGKLGLLCAMTLALSSPNVTLIGRHPDKLAVAKARGIECVLSAEVGPPMRAAFDVVVEASGSASGFEKAVELVKPLGRIVLKSTFHGNSAWPAARIVVDEITIIGSRCGRLAPAIELLEKGLVDLDGLIDDRFPLDDGVAAMARAAEPGALKVLLIAY